MIKRTIKDFDYDTKIYKSYKNKEDKELYSTKHIKDINKINRTKWKLHLKKILMMERADSLERAKGLVLRKK